MATELPFRLILASASLGRRDLLRQANYQFDIQPSHIDEPTDATYPNVRTLVQHISWLKAAAVAAQVQDGVVVAADTVGWLDEQVIAKPEDEADARRILRHMSGRVHELWTGVCLWRRPDDLQFSWQEVSRVLMRAMTEQDLDIYLATRTWQGCSGAYAIREHNDPYVQVIEGSMSNVIGLPMETLQRTLAAMAKIHPKWPWL